MPQIDTHLGLYLNENFHVKIKIFTNETLTYVYFAGVTTT